MWFRTLFDSLKQQRSRTPTQPPRRGHLPRRVTPRRLIVEALEDRSLLTALLTVGDAVILEGNTGTPHAAIVVSLTEPHGNSVTANYRTVDGTARAGSDYNAMS